jgi:hypothetical protein
MKAGQREAFKPLLRMMDKVSDPALTFLLVQIPFLFGTISLGIGRHRDLRSWGSLASFLIGIMKTSETEIQVCAAYGLGMLARIWCNAYGWALERGACPRPICVAFGTFSHGWDSSAFPIRRTFAHWRLLEPFWLGTLNMDVITRSELVRTSAAIIRRASKWLLFGLHGIYRMVRTLWEMLPFTEFSHLQRFALATEVGALFTDSGLKVLPKTKTVCNGAAQRTKENITSCSFDYMCHIESEMSVHLCGKFLVSTLGSIMSGIEFYLIEGRVLILYAVLQMAKYWSSPRRPSLAIAA